MAKAEYCRRFAIVEIQQTFYNLPRVQTAEKWRREALALRSRSGQADFEFTLKAWQLITHEPSGPTYRRLRRPIPDAEKNLYGSFRPTEPVLKAWTDTAAVARAMGVSVVVFQCPLRFTPTAAHVENLRKQPVHGRGRSPPSDTSGPASPPSGSIGPPAPRLTSLTFTSLPPRGCPGGWGEG
jgi:uncharacterized protein YecE (DUF72 family)